MNKKTYLILLLLVIAFQLACNLLLTLSYNNNATHINAKVTKLKYIVFNWLENQLYLYKIVDDKSIPDLDWQHDNQLKCSMPNLEHMDRTAIAHLDADFNKLHTLFEACPLTNNSYQLDTLINVLGSTSDSATLKIQLRIDLIRQGYTQNGDDPVCSNWYLDKKINVSEMTNELEFGEEFVFTQKNNWTLSTNKPGYYFVKCVLNRAERFKPTETLFEFVYTVLPGNMTVLMERRQVFRQYERLAGDAVRENPLIKDAEFEQCQGSGDDTEKREEQRMNVLVIGLDSISSAHFRRVFPLTFAELEQTAGNVIFDKLNSVGSNTYPNMLALLAGIIEEPMSEYDILNGEIEFYRRLDSTSFHDLLPFIWKRFEELGYVTMYQEDDPYIAIFNFIKDGFRYWPAGLYNRAFNLQYYATRSGPDKCHHAKPSYATWLQQIELFLDRMNSSINQNTPFFSFNFLTEMTHNYLAVPGDFDRLLVSLLKKLQTSGVLDNTLLIIMGDHGNRILKYSYATEMGKLERYRPFLSIKLPARLAGTRHFSHLVSNKNQLVSFFDLYQTLRHFLYMNQHGISETTPNCSQQFKANLASIRSRRGISLLEQLPKNRTCRDALIPNHLCQCFDQVVLSNAQFQLETGLSYDKAALVLLNYINGLTSDYRSLCEPFHLNRTVSVKRINMNNIRFYTVLVVFEPGEAWFEANLLHDGYKSLRVYKTPTRMSRYDSQSHCIQNDVLKNFCFCRDQSTSTGNS